MSELNDQQLAVVNSKSSRILCLAGAGSGKTFTLIQRIAKNVQDGVDPRSILALTFTNAAAFEMKERFARIPGLNLSKGQPEFRTFHSFCYSLIIKDRLIRDKIGYTKIPQVCEDSDLKEIRTRIKLQLGIKLSDEQLETGKGLSLKDKDAKELFDKALIKALRDQNVITFDIMCYNVCELFVRNDPCIQTYKQKYKYIYCDEFQDSDKRQFRFLSSFPPETNFCFVGDALQNIYSFRGTSNEYIKALATSPDWEVIRLFKNYRSTRNICNFANKFSKYAKDDYRIEMEGQRDGVDPKVIYGSKSTYYNPVDEYHLKILVDKIKANPNTETAVLCRSNREVSAVKSALKDNQIDFSSRSKSTDNIELLESALSNDYLLEWLSTKLDAKDYGDYVRLSSQQDVTIDLKTFLSMYSRVHEVKVAADKVAEIRRIASSSDSPKDKFESIAKILRIKSKCKFAGDDKTTNEEVVNMLKERVEEIEECEIYVGTVHSVKGLEYDTVYVMGVDDKLFELGSEEMNNLYYVAVTRAKNNLTVFRR